MTRNYTLTLLTVLLSVLCAISPAMAQSDYWYTSDQALSSSLIKKIIHDRNDIIWIATENGLNRFDGSKFTAFHHHPDQPGSLANEFVNSVFESSDGRMFVCTHGGVQLYDDATQTFSAPLPLKDGTNYTGAVAQMLELPSGEIWTIGSDILRVTGNATEGHHLEWVDRARELTFTQRGIADESGNVWVTRNTPGVYRLCTDGTIQQYMTEAGAPVFETFAIGADGTLYAGTQGDGLYRYNSAADRFEKQTLRYHDPVSVMAIYPDESGSLLLATDGKGLVVCNLERGVSWNFQIPNVDYNKLKVHTIDKDMYGNLWIGVYQKGMLRVPERSAFFSSINERNNSNIIGSSCITSIFRDADGTLWVGTDNDGVYAVDRWMYRSRHYDSGVPQVVMSLHQDSRGNLWVGSYGEGAGILDKATGAFRPIDLGPAKDTRKVYDFSDGPDGSLLIATMGAGIYRYDHATGKATPVGDADSCNPWVTSIDYIEPADRILAGTYDGLYILDADGGNPTRLMPGVIINTVKYDPLRHCMWVGTNEGLHRLDRTHTVIGSYGTAQGLPGRSVYAIEDDGRHLWISTNHGLSRFNPQDGTFTNFTVADGLPNNEFAKDASFRDANGTMYFGGINGITTFRPDDITAGGRKLTLRITDFFLAGNPVNAGMESGGRTIIDVPVYEARVFRLGSDDNTFSVRFNTKEMVNASTAQYYYSFDGGDWNKVAENNEKYGGATLTFTNVPYGHHTLSIKVVEDGVESEPLTVEIDIAYPWYLSWWMKVIYALLGLVALWGIWRMATARSRRRRAELERRHNSEIMEARLKFFTDISHEIRTPLSLVLGPVQKLIDTDHDRERGYSYKTIARNARRILRLVNELMDLRKIDNHQMRLRYSRVDLVAFAADLYETFLPSAQAKGVTLVYEHPGLETLEAWVDKSNFDKILMNLLSNAVKFTPAGGTVTLTLGTGADPGATGPLARYATVTVTDTGIGIDRKDQESVFNRFFQASNNHGAGGTGIGLHLTHQLVELHHGTITVADNPAGQGTRFEVRVPLGDAHIDAADKVPDTPGRDHAPHTPEALADITPDLPEAPAAPAPPEARTPAHAKETVYIVEDNPEILQYLNDNLSRRYRTRTFTNGREALDAIHEQRPDLVITDVMMPEMDGMTLTRKINQNINLNHIPVIILTAKTREEDNMEAMDAGAAAFITKPFNMDVLIKTVQNALASKQRLRNAFSGQQHQQERMEDIKAVSNDEKLLDRVMREINKNLSNSDITVEMIAKNIGISRVHLHRKLKELTNQSTRDFIRNIRLQAGARLLREKKLSVAEVSDMVGFKQPNNFSTAFKEMFGMTPSAYCDKHHKAQPPAEP